MQEYEPFNWSEGDLKKGGMLEVVQAVCVKMKIKCIFESMPMKRVIAMLTDGDTDGVLSLTPNSDREAFAELSVPIIESNMSYFAVKGNFKKIKKISELEGATVGAVATSSAEKMVHEHKQQLAQLTVIGETGLPILLNKFIAGRYGVKGLAFANQDVFSNLLRKAQFEKYDVVYVARKESFRVAFSKKKVAPDFIKKFNFQIIKMKESGELKRILAPYRLQSAH